MLKLRNAALISIGIFFVLLGVLGVFLPLLPTTPFLLLAAACFSTSSQKFYSWLINNKYLGDFIRNYREGNGVRLKNKIVAITSLWICILYTSFATSIWLWTKALLILIACGVTIHLILIKTLKS